MTILAGQRATANDLNAAPASYDPTLTASTSNPVLGSGSTRTGWWYRIGDWVIGEARFRFGSSGVSAGNGVYIVSLPAAPDPTWHDPSTSVGLGSQIGAAILRDNSVLANSTPVGLFLYQAATAAMVAPGAGVVSSANPWAWAISDALSVAFRYRIVP